MSRLQIAVISGLGAALVASGVVILQQSRKLAEVRQQRDAAMESLQNSREALRQSERRAAIMHQAPKPANNDKAVIAQQKMTIQQLTGKLSAAQASITQFQEELSSTKDANQKALAASSQQSQKMQAELQARLDKLQQELSSAQAKVQSSAQRIASLQKLNNELQNSNNDASTRAAEREHILSRLQDLDRRRESYLRSIADRYRNLTSQFRTMSGMMDSNHGQNSNALSAPALDMIQNAITLSDSDFQHLSELNAKAFRLQKQLSRN